MINFANGYALKPEVSIQEAFADMNNAFSVHEQLAKIEVVVSETVRELDRAVSVGESTTAEDCLISALQSYNMQSSNPLREIVYIPNKLFPGEWLVAPLMETRRDLRILQGASVLSSFPYWSEGERPQNVGENAWELRARVWCGSVDQSRPIRNQGLVQFPSTTLATDAYALKAPIETVRSFVPDDRRRARSLAEFTLLYETLQQGGVEVNVQQFLDDHRSAVDERMSEVSLTPQSVILDALKPYCVA